MPKFGYNELAQKIYDLVSLYCKFPGPIMETQCKRLKKSPLTITEDDVPTLAAYIRMSVANFTNPQKGERVEADILKLQNRAGQ